MFVTLLEFVLKVVSLFNTGKAKFGDKSIKLVHQMKMFVVQSFLVDIVFSATFDLLGNINPEDCNTITLFSKFIALCSLSIIMYELLQMFITARKDHSEIGIMDKEFLTDGLDLETFAKHK